jgi:hypothetical protein
MEKNPSLLKLQICRSKIQEFPLMDRAPVSSCFMLIAQVDSGNLHTTQVDCSKTQPPWHDGCLLWGFCGKPQCIFSAFYQHFPQAHLRVALIIQYPFLRLSQSYLCHNTTPLPLWPWLKQLSHQLSNPPPVASPAPDSLLPATYLFLLARQPCHSLQPHWWGC